MKWLKANIVITIVLFSQQTIAVQSSLPAIVHYILQENQAVTAHIKPSRTDCVSPCTVVFSAIESRASGLDEHEIWHRLIYRFDFYDLPVENFPLSNKPKQFEVGGPMATRTLMCESGICQHRIGLRVQDEIGNFDDAYAMVTVRAESQQFSVSNTVCISNTLNLNDNWSGFDKACPLGASKRNDVLLPDDYSNKLVLFRRGDVFARNLYPRMGQSNFKIGYFGNHPDPRPEIQGELTIGPASISNPLENPPSSATFISDSQVNQFGWTSNVTVEGLRVRQVNYPMSYQHIGIHDMDLDFQANDSGGRISTVRRAALCHRYQPLSCSNVPFPVGAYISDTVIKGSESGAVANEVTLNIANVPCGMVVYKGIVGVELGNSGEHNMRDMGYWKTNVSHSHFTGHHKASGRSKLTIRSCGDVHDESQLVGKFVRDPEGRTRDDADTGLQSGGNDDHSHQSRYYLVQNNVFGDQTVLPSDELETFSVAASTINNRDHYMEDILVTRNVFLEDGKGGNASFVHGRNMTCVGNIYALGNIGCGTSNANERNIIEERTDRNTLPDYLPLDEPDPAPNQ